MSWSFSLPIRIELGVGKVFGELGRLIEGEGLSNGLLISDPVFVKNGLADQAVEASKGGITGVFSDLVPNLTVENVNTCSGLVGERGYESLVCLEGGSPLDCGKTVGSLYKTRDSIREYMYGKKTSGPGYLPLTAIPTIAGAGSEVTMVAVISDEGNNKKVPVETPNFYPDLAILDPRLTLSLPPPVTASYEIDVPSQALEGYWSRNHQPVYDACAVKVCSLVFEYLERACKDENDPEARTAMCEASLLAGIAFAAPKTGGPRVCSYPLTSIYHMLHSEAYGIILDSFLRLNKDAQGGCLHRLAKMVGRQDACELTDDILILKQRAGLRCGLSEAGISEGDTPLLIKEYHHPNMALNPMEVTDEILGAILRKLLQNMDTIHTPGLCGVMLLAYLIGATLGFGGIVTTLSLCNMIVGIHIAIPATAAIVYAATLMILVYSRVYVEKRAYTVMFLLMVLGMPIGMAAYSCPPERPLKLVLGIFTIPVAPKGLFWHDRRKKTEKWIGFRYYVCLFPGGVIRGAFSYGGVLAVIYANRAITDKRLCRMALSVIWFSLNLLLTLKNVVIGSITLPAARLSVCGLPFVAAAVIAGNRMISWLNTKTSGTAVYVMLPMSECLQVLRQTDGDAKNERKKLSEPRRRTIPDPGGWRIFL